MAVVLAEHFEKVIATDASKNQIENATPHPKVDYKVGKAENSGLPENSFDLITAAQALHWLDLEKFYKEVKRVGEKGALLAVWGYGLHSVDQQVDKVLKHFYYDIIGPYWPPERKYVDERYENIPFPFGAIPSPVFEMKISFTLEELLGYLGTWSATQRYIKSNQTDPVKLVKSDLKKAWGKETEKVVSWPLFLKAGVV